MAVGFDHVTSHLSARNAPYAIVPDILAHNFPTGRQKVGHSGATTASAAIFEVKTYSACNTRFTYPTTIHPADRRAQDVKHQYIGKFKKVDCVFVADVVGDGTGNVVGPFEMA